MSDLNCTKEDVLEVVERIKAAKGQAHQAGLGASSAREVFCSEHGIDAKAFGVFMGIFDIADDDKRAARAATVLALIELTDIHKRPQLVMQPVAERDSEQLGAAAAKVAGNGGIPLDQAEARFAEHLANAPKRSRKKRSLGTEIADEVRADAAAHVTGEELPEGPVGTTHVGRLARAITVHDGTPGEAMKASTAAGDAHLKDAIAKSENSVDILQRQLREERLRKLAAATGPAH